jgi:pyruvate,water dikinase
LEPYVIKLAELGMNDVEIVGGKNASLGEMISNLNSLGVSVPGGFATTAAAYRSFLAAGGLDERINQVLTELDVDDIDALTRTPDARSSQRLGGHVRRKRHRRRSAIVGHR